MASTQSESLGAPIASPPTYMFVYGTLKNGEANFNRWIAPFMAADNKKKTEEKADNGDSSASSCTCCLKFCGPALTVHRYPFAIYDYPGVYNAPFDQLVEAPTDAEELRQLNAIEDVDPSRVFYEEPQRILGEVFEILPCEKHSAAGADLNTSRVVERLDVLEDTASGLYSRQTVDAEVATGNQTTMKVSAQIYFRTNAYPREELIDMMWGVAQKKKSSSAASIVTREAVEAITPKLLSEGVSSEQCVAEGRVAAPKLRGFMRTYRGADHHKITACE